MFRLFFAFNLFNLLPLVLFGPFFLDFLQVGCQILFILFVFSPFAFWQKGLGHRKMKSPQNSEVAFILLFLGKATKSLLDVWVFVSQVVNMQS